MACASVISITCLNNPAPANETLRFEVTMECMVALEQDLEFKLIFYHVGDGETANGEKSSGDQELETVDLGPLQPSTFKFVFEADAPNFKSIPETEMLDVAVIYFSVLYKTQEFCRVGYYLKHAYSDPELQENPPSPIDLAKVERTIDMDAVRVTRYPIKWDGEVDEDMPPSQVEDESAEIVEPCA